MALPGVLLVGHALGLAAHTSPPSPRRGRRGEVGLREPSYAPGLYPTFDSRAVFLHFDERGVLAAINVREWYILYP